MATSEICFQLLGRLSVFYATWDFLVTLVLLKLSEPAEHEMRDNSTLGQKLRRIKNLKSEQVKDTKLLAELQANIDDAIEVANRRNRFLHDQLIFDPNLLAKDKLGKVQITGLDGGKLSIDKTELCLNEIQDLISRVGQFQKDYGAVAATLDF